MYKNSSVCGVCTKAQTLVLSRYKSLTLLKRNLMGKTANPSPFFPARTEKRLVNLFYLNGDAARGNAVPALNALLAPKSQWPESKEGMKLIDFLFRSDRLMLYRRNWTDLAGWRLSGRQKTDKEERLG